MSKLCVNKKDCLDFFPFNFHEFILGIVNRFIFYFISKRSLCQKVNCNNQASAFYGLFRNALFVFACMSSDRPEKKHMFVIATGSR